MTTAVSVRTVRNSPFRESEWDSRLDHLLEDLENSAQRSHSAERNTVTTTSFKASASSASASVGHGVLSKSKSTSSLTGAATDNMLKDLDTALKASTNYIESHRRVELPNGHQEYHESRYTSSSGVPPSSGDFNLERQVQHMMPSNYASSSNSHSQQQFNSGLQSANMVSSMQTSTSKQSYTSYKVQSNSYTSRNLDFQDQEQDRPGSRLKANIDELDTLLSDLNNAQTTNNTTSRHHETSSEDYGDQAMKQGHVKTTINSLNEYTMSSGTSGDYHRKPPSPSPVRRTPVMSSPIPRRTSPSPAACRKASPPSGPAMMSSNTMSASSNYSYNYNSSRNSSPPRKRSPSPRLVSATPTGHAYYSKYHSSYSQQQKQGGPASFPTCPSPSPNRGPSVQTPPKKVDDLMTELSEFDPSIRHTGFTEPVAPARSHNKYSSSHASHVQTVDLSEELDSRYNKREPSPIKPSVKQPSHPGPAVYYPPGELFSSTRNNETLNSDMSHCAPAVPAAGQASHATTMETSASSRGRAKMRAEYGYKEKGRYSEGDTKQGAAVVPICLPLCCAAPCVIL